MYQLEALESTTDVGYRGEHTAAILELNSTQRVTYLKPPRNADSYEPQKLPKGTGWFNDAVIEWLRYLGVASDIDVSDAGVFGHRLRVNTYPKGAMHDLTNVGVGVSQVLPIVVMALLAAPGSLLIFEQPELHLHPKVQARLADFFISIVYSGKQLILETHSEYLIDRFRLRIAQTDDDNFRNMINVLFTDQNNGQTRLTPIEVSEYGAIINWPAEFFDQSQSEVTRLIKAASKKRREKAKPEPSP